MSSRNNGGQEELREQESSDEENPIIPEIHVLSHLSGLPVRSRASVANAPGTSGNTPPAPPPSSAASPARRHNRLERDRFFWTLMGNSSRTHPRCRNGAGSSRGARPSTVADLIAASNNHFFQPSRCPSYAETHTAPSTSSIAKSLRHAIRQSIQEHDRISNRNASAGRPLMLVRTSRSERSSEAPEGTGTSTQLSEEDMEVRVGSPSTTDDYVETVIEVAEPINMTTGAISLEEEIVEIDTEPEASAPPPADPQPAREELQGSSTDEPEQARAVKRKREVTGDTHESVSSLNQCLLGLLECPVCMEWMEPPIAQCRRGHLVCGACRKRLDTCPVCRTAFSSVRNRAMENVAGILRYPCRHGCGREVRHARRARHEASCSSRRYACPLPACESAPPMQRAALPAHCQSRHPQQYRPGCSQRVSLRVNCEQHQQWVAAALEQLFHVRVDVDVRTWGVVVYVAFLGPQKQAKNYTYEVKVSGRHNCRGLVYKRTTHSDLESSVLNTSRQDCFHLTLDQALNFLRYKNEHSETDKTLDFTINIAECEEAEESREISDCGSPKE